METSGLITKAIVLLVLLTTYVESVLLFRHGREHGGMLGAPNVPENIALPPDEWFQQQLDHFNPTNTQTWRQRYYTNATFFKPGGPVFLMIGGEGEATAKWMVEGQWIEYAKKYNALCFQLEHRFYGKSHPTEDLSVKNLVYLSSEQALADLAYFIKAMTEKHELEANSKWIAFGGSYPGSLAAWLRAKYPHLVHGSVSASGPLLAKIDFQEYFGVVDDSLAAYSERCVKDISESAKQLGMLLNHPLGQRSVNSLFKLCDPINVSIKDDVANLYEGLAGNFAGVVQYNKDNRKSSKSSNITIDTVCDVMANDSMGAPVHRYAAVSNMLLEATNQTCFDYKYAKMIADMRNTSWLSETAEGGRQWTYQTCTEFGFYQTSTLSPHIFGELFPVEFFVKQCADIFGPRFNDDFLTRVVDRTNTLYGAYALQVTRVVFVHGSVDPWHALGITQSLSNEAPAIYIEGTAHCANMYPSSPADPPQLVAARHEISRLIGVWLDEE